jgi:hypothetical protein
MEEGVVVPVFPALKFNAQRLKAVLSPSEEGVVVPDFLRLVFGRATFYMINH